MANEIAFAKDLSLAYDSREVVLRDLSFSINEGDLIFVTGASGSGKSTLIKAFYGAVAPIKGYLRVGGVKMPADSKSSIDRLRRKLGIVFQDYRLIEEWSIERNIALPLYIAGYDQKRIKDQVEKLLKHVRLTHRRDRFPQELSGGEQQRVAVARALSHNPMLLLADEPTGNLDDFSAQLVHELFMAVNQLGKTVVIVTHRMPSIAGVNYRHFRIDEGRLVEINY
ncbi:MAG: ATP-binding cassette domain-containing protein [Helicobacteraceae bacterium]|jgi:cell division transport system ATP-binding protein|nr:ATP-binding cassette domain-containing protein [Helicobacteraceae bacterium]